MNIKFPENLKRLRKSRGISQEELASQLGLSKGAISQYEAGRAYPGVDGFIKLCEIFHVSLDEIILGNSPKMGNSPAIGTSETAQQQPQENNQHHLQKEIEYLTKTVAMQEREINTMRSYTARLEKELEKCEDSLGSGQQSPRQTG